MHRIVPVFFSGWFCLVSGLAWGAADSELVQRIQEKLKGSPLLMSRQIRVEVRGGIASLSGDVLSLREIWKARELAEKVTGIRELNLQLQIVGSQPSDLTLAAKVKRTLDLDPKLQSAGVKVLVEGGVVTLSGNLPDARERFDAREAAAGIPGVREVIDHLVSPDQEDGVILRGLQSLLGPRALDKVPGEYEPSVMEGIVTLEGKAPRLFERSQAERAAWGINGVKRVINLITIHPPHEGFRIIDPGNVPARPPADPN